MSRITQQVITRFLLVAGLWATFLQATSFAQNASIKPGLWEIEQVFEMPGAPQGGFKNQWQHCVKEEDAKQGPVFSDVDRSKGTSKAGECRIENLRYPERGHVTYDIVCGKKATRMKVEYRYTETTFEGTTRMVSEGRSFSFKMKGRYVGSCKE
jgi:hypothetical protein